MGTNGLARAIRHRRATAWSATVAVATTALTVGLAANPTDDRDRSSAGDHFVRMFGLPPFAAPTPDVSAALSELGKRGGLMDANDNLAAGPVALIVDPALNVNNPNNDAHTAGVTFVGQFLDHDMTFDETSRLGRPTNPRLSPNTRHPYFDLDSVYGDGPTGSSQLYDPADSIKFKVESGGPFEDLPRDSTNTALVADPRNDENVILAGLQIAFLKFHNHAVDVVRAKHPSWTATQVFGAARQQTTWHYQWLIVHQFLPLFVGQSMVTDVLENGRRFYRPTMDEAAIPVEFQIAYRFGHSLVRPSYRLNFTGNAGQPFFAMVFSDQPGLGEPGDLRGGFRAPRRFVGWQTFFRFPGFEADVRPNKRIDTKLSTALFDLPIGAIASGQPPTSLAERNLLRHLTWSVPSGQAIAEAMGAPVLDDDDFAELAGIRRSFMRSTPLWYYILREADILGGGTHLGPVGGRIVAEVFLGLLQADRDSYLHQRPAFVPTLGAGGGQFDMTHFLTFAGVATKR